MGNVIYYVPHQDDEILSFGVSIIHHIIEGHQVHLVFYTDGSSSKALNYFNGNEICPLHQEMHDFQFDEQKFSEVRNQEMIWSSQCLGVHPSHFHWCQDTKDGQFSVNSGIDLITRFEAKFPNAQHMALSYTDPHPDHANMGKALLKLLQQGKVQHGKFYLKTLELDKFDGIEDPCKEEYLPFLHAAQQAYKVYKPEAGLYAIGNHSVASTFEIQYKNPRCKYHFAGE